MPLRLSQVISRTPAGHVGPENWLEASTRVFIGSTAFDIVKRDLRRYVDGEINGRSHLIAGHRGAGKTALVLAAIEAVRFEVLTGPASGQRPLLVKLHGPSLFSGALPGSSEDAAATDTVATYQATRGSRARELTVDDTADKAAAGRDGPPSGQVRNAASSPRPPQPEDRLRAALAQITVALYRAVASEVAEAFRIQVIQACTSAPDIRLLELAAQLNLELDNGSTAGVLRGFWNKLDRLLPGVLWPQDWPPVRADQGLREIVAIATASQAFQVCIGAIDYKTRTTDAESNNQTAKSGLQLDAGPALKRLAGLLGGAALGGALAAGGVEGRTAAIAGVAAGLIGATFSVSSERARDRSQSASYEFIRDTSVTTLDRDLPEVIERLRRAGLRPVFLVDELDKLGDVSTERRGEPDQDDAPDRLRDLVDRLKNLTTDYGFFCFLTNRDYYESLRRKLRAGTFPREHTYFSNMHYLLCSAADQLRYVLQAVSCTLSEADKEAPLHWMALAFAARLRSRMNVISLVRELNRHVDSTGALRPELRALGQLPSYRLFTAMQMVIDLKLAEPDVQARIEDDPIFGQLVADALYRLPVALEAGESFVCLSEPELTKYLRARSGNCLAGGAAIDQFSDSERSWLAELTAQAARMLCDFTSLSALASLYWTQERQQAVLPARGADPVEKLAVSLFASLMPAPSPAAGLVQEDQPFRFIFLLNKFSVPVQRARPAAAAPPPAGGSRQSVFAEAATALLGNPADQTRPGILAALQLTISYLKELGVLAAIVPDETSVQRALSSGSEAAAQSDSTAIVETFVEAIVQASAPIAWAALLTRSVGAAAEEMATKRRDVPLLPYSEAALRAGIARHIRFARTLDPNQPLNVAEALRCSSIDFADIRTQLMLEPPALPRIGHFDTAAMHVWAASIGALPPLTVDEAALIQDPWIYWRGQVAAFFGNAKLPSPISLSQLVLSVRGVPPSGMFRWDLGTMSIRGWSEVALAAYRQLGSSGEPGDLTWAAVAALYQLGFDARTLKEATIRSTVSDTSMEEGVLVTRIMSLPPLQPAARILYIVESGGRSIVDEPPPAGVASFAVRHTGLFDASSILDILGRGGQMSVNVV